MIVGICGGSGSGKTTLLKRLCSQFSDLQPSVFSMDNYYLPIEEQKLEAQDLALEYFSCWPIEAHQSSLKNIVDALDLFDFAKADDILKEISRTI